MNEALYLGDDPATERMMAGFPPAAANSSAPDDLDWAETGQAQRREDSRRAALEAALCTKTADATPEQVLEAAGKYLAFLTA